MSAVGGTISVRANGELLRSKGDFTYGLGTPKREAVVGDGVLGYTEQDQVPFIEGKIVDARDFDFVKLANLVDATVTIELKTGKSLMLTGAWFAGEGSGSTESGEISVRFDGTDMKVTK
ncbi:MAG: phage tail tube protein [Planctomycetes bacterium]|nr:phage tail tube protein [Planctomycetota bacterium]